MIVGLTGPNAAGKGEVVAHLRALGFAAHSLSDVVRDEAAARGVAPEREQLIRIGNELRRAGGAGILAERILPRLGGRDVVDSIRNPSEVAVMRRLPAFWLLGVDAPARVRFARSVARSRPGDPVTFEEFEERERQENSSDPDAQQLATTLVLADRVVTNGGSIEALHAEIDRTLAALGSRPLL
jgi:dephospho-CoA kinase